MTQTFYAIYDKDDFLLFVGNSKECSMFLNLTLASFYCRMCRPQKNKKYTVYKFEDEGE